jgi:Na+-driven multidrug efflux pump
MGTSALASVNIAEAAMNLMFVALLGSAAGTSVLTGKKIGEGDFIAANDNGIKFIRLAVVEGFIIAFICAALSSILPKGFNVSDEIRNSSTLIILIFALFLPVKAFNLHTIVGIFRGGGDTLYAAGIEISGVWGVGVTLAFLTGLYFKLPIHIVYIFVCLEEVYKSIFNYRRVKSGKWLHDLT